MPDGLTPSEKLVESLSEKAFLKLWTHPNPIGKKGKELCDCLVVCGPHIIIISVKENKYKKKIVMKDGEEKDVGLERWTKAAIEKSMAQVWGAERWLKKADKVERHDKRVITLPPKNERQYHRVAVALGSKGQIPIVWGDHKNGYVHVCDEFSLDVVFGVLDTIADFVNFLTAIETSKCCMFFDGGGIEDLVALYLQNGNSLEIEPKAEMLVLLDDIWKGFSENGELNAMKKELSISYKWDEIIEYFSDTLLSGKMIDLYNNKLAGKERENQLAFAEMALQPRGYRASLAKAYIEFLTKPELKSLSRCVLGYNGTAFVFTLGSSDDRTARKNELALRCLIVRGRMPNVTKVVGISADRPEPKKVAFSEDIVYLDIPVWTDEFEKTVEDAQANFGYFRNMKKLSTQKKRRPKFKMPKGKKKVSAK